VLPDLWDRVSPNYASYREDTATRLELRSVLEFQSRQHTLARRPGSCLERGG